jgi:hypothetical protein
MARRKDHATFLEVDGRFRAHLIVVRFGVGFVAQLNQQSQVLIGTKAGIQAELDFDGGQIGAIVMLQTLQTLLQLRQFGLLLSALRLGLGQPGLHLVQGLFPALTPLPGSLPALAGLSQATGGALWALMSLIGPPQVGQYSLPFLLLLVRFPQASLGVGHRLLLDTQSLLAGDHLLSKSLNALL